MLELQRGVKGRPRPALGGGSGSWESVFPHYHTSLKLTTKFLNSNPCWNSNIAIRYTASSILYLLGGLDIE